MERGEKPGTWSIMGSMTCAARFVRSMKLGRIMVPGNNGTHFVKIVDGITGLDVPGGSATVNIARGTPGSFIYGALASPITLDANRMYYFLSQETQGGDQWYDYNTTVQTSNIARESVAAYSWGVLYVTTGLPGQTYGPVDFQYAPAN